MKTEKLEMREGSRKASLSFYPARGSKMKKYLIGLLTYISLCSLLAAAITVSPMTINQTFEKGKSYQLPLLIKNTSDSPKGFRLYSGDRTFDKFGSSHAAKPGTNPRSSLDWLEFPQGIINLEAKDRKQLFFTVKVPDSVHGTYWANLYVEETKPSQQIKADKPGVTVNVLWRSQVSLNFTVHSESEVSAGISRMEIKQDSSGKRCLEIEIMNTCPEKIMCRGYYEIRDQYGNTLEKMNLHQEGEFSIYPSYSRIVISKFFSTDFKTGIYPCIAVLDFGGENLIAGQTILKIAEK